MERASAAIAAAGGPGDAPRIEGPQGKGAVNVPGASLSLTGVAVAARGEDSGAVSCASKGHAELGASAGYLFGAAFLGIGPVFNLASVAFLAPLAAMTLSLYEAFGKELVAKRTGVLASEL